MADVSIVRCASYDADECRVAPEAAIAAVGGLDWVRDGMKIAVKVNLVSAMRPEEAATVHPVLLTELVKLLHSRGASVVLGDSPGGLYTAAHLNHVYDVTGLRACEAAGAQLNQNFAQAHGENPAARQARHFQYTAWLDDADAIIDFCKLKTHGQIGMTCAVKNFFGTIPGTMKPEYHYKYPKIEDFADMIVASASISSPGSACATRSSAWRATDRRRGRRARSALCSPQGAPTRSTLPRREYWALSRARCRRSPPPSTAGSAPRRRTRWTILCSAT
mgnify:CR=1 FL=1